MLVLWNPTESLNEFGPREKCAVFGAYSSTPDAARLTYYGLFALQHRGQEGSGIAASDGRIIREHKAEGLVPQVYSENIMQLINGAHIAIGHNRYGTSHGHKHSDYYLQPVHFYPDFALAHNGNIPCVKKMQSFLTSKNIDVSHKNDSQLIYDTIYVFFKQSGDMCDALTQAQEYFEGAYSLLMLTPTSLYAYRDPYGIRPLSLGVYDDNNFVIASETCAINTVQAQLVRDVKPGELIEISDKGLKTCQVVDGRETLDLFEFVYFARPDSYLYGHRVHEVRRRFGKLLGSHLKFNADVVVPVPDSAIPSAEGVSETTGVSYRHALIKNRYIARTFISPGEHLRDSMSEMKYNVISEAVKDKSVILVDDSIVRLNTIPRLVNRLYREGAREVHVAIASAPVLFPDFYGIDLAEQKKLVAAWHSLDEMKNLIGCASLTYLPYVEMIQAVGVDESMLYTGCFTGKYPTDLGDSGKLVGYDVKNRPDNK